MTQEAARERAPEKVADQKPPDAAVEPPRANDPLALLPAWAQELALKYKGGTITQFIIHGTVHDLVALRESRDQVRYVSLREFLEKSVFGRRDAVIRYDQASGITFSNPELMSEFNRVVSAVDTAAGTKYASALPREPRGALFLIERFIRAAILSQSQPRRLAVIVDHAAMLVAAGDFGSLSSEEISSLITLLKWSNDPAFLKADLTICLIAENLADLNQALVRNPYTAKVHIDLPTKEERLDFVRYLGKELPLAENCDVPFETLADLTAGLNRVNLMHLVHQAVKNSRRLSTSYVQAMKKELIEKECYGLLEFLEPKYTLDMVSGCDTAKQWLKEDAKLISEGQLDVLPMGYLICGPVGTGKTFLSQCYTGTIGIPCVKLLNFRSQWQGVTEGNWEKILNVLKATGPVGVIIDEADAAVGNRSNSGDSGTSARVFSQLASQMGDTRYRGKILWFLLTCRPDLLPVDLKRQGRCEVHIPLFYPATAEERLALFQVMAKKSGAKVNPEVLKEVAGKMTLKLSGAEIEGLIVRARRRAMLAGHEELLVEDLQSELEAYLPPQYGEEIDLQIYAAIAECTDRRFLPDEFRDLNRGEVALKLAKLKRRWE
jgi:SpoVK/Ycf46/Vps4 family AAA+-type ATPase